MKMIWRIFRHRHKWDARFDGAREGPACHVGDTMECVYEVTCQSCGWSDLFGGCEIVKML